MKGFSTSGDGHSVIDRVTNQLLLTKEINDASMQRGVGVKCRAWNDVIPELQPLCMSFVDAQRPGWYAIVRSNGDIYYEPEWAPKNPVTFDHDASFIFHVEKFLPGTGAISAESLSLPNHFFAALDGRLAVAEFEDTPEFHLSASWYGISDDTLKGTSAFCLCIYTNVSML